MARQDSGRQGNETCQRQDLLLEMEIIIAYNHYVHECAASRIINVCDSVHPAASLGVSYDLPGTRLPVARHDFYKVYEKIGTAI